MFSRLEGRRVCACKPGYREDRDLCLINPDAGQHTGVTSYPLGGEEGGGGNQGIEKKAKYAGLHTGVTCYRSGGEGGGEGGANQDIYVAYNRPNG